jgi:hypothetical protein
LIEIDGRTTKISLPHSGAFDLLGGERIFFNKKILMKKNKTINAQRALVKL